MTETTADPYASGSVRLPGAAEPQESAVKQKERRVDALALGADERRDKLR